MNFLAETLSKLYNSVSRGYAYTPLNNATFRANQFSLNSRFVKVGAIILTGLILFGLSSVFVHTDIQPSSLTLTKPVNVTEHVSNGATPSPAELVGVDDHIDWSQFAYVQYVTNSEYLCNSVMLFAKLEQLGCKGKRLMMYPSKWGIPPMLGSRFFQDGVSKLLALARDSFQVQLQPIDVLQRAGHNSTWSQSYTKLLAFNQTQFKRVLSLDSDSTVLQCMDELFLIPSATIGLPKAYWKLSKDHDESFFSSQLMLVEPTEKEWARINHAIEVAPHGQFDMDILNSVYRQSATILPHRPYNLLSGEFNLHANKLDRSHEGYLGSSEEKWDAKKIYQEAKFIHFSDWPIPKPWFTTNEIIREKGGPVCNGEDCSDRDVWYTLYNDFKKQRSEVCGARLVQLTPPK